MKSPMKRLFCLLLVFLLPCVAIAAGGDDDDEDISFFDIIGTDQTAVRLPQPTPDKDDPSTWYEKDGSLLLTVSCTGDVTIGRNKQYSGASIYETELKKQKGDVTFPFRNVRDIFYADDLTLVNFEGVLTTDTSTTPSSKTNNDYLFYAPPEYVQALTAGNVEAVSFENNHCRDFGEAGYSSTTSTLEEAGVVWSGNGHLGVYTVKGVTIGMLSYQTFNGAYTTLREQVPVDIAAAKETCQIVIVSYHWGNELDYAPNDNQVSLGHLTIDAGADLVIGHHSHRINPIEEYNGHYICYSLGNFSFAGNSKPSDMSTFIFQTRFRLRDGVIAPEGFIIIPCRISSHSDYNDFIPTPYTNATSIDGVLTVLKSNSTKLGRAVTDYPLAW